MWHLTATLLVLGLTSATPNGYNYNGPRHVCPAITSVLYNTRVQTSRNIRTVNQAVTRFVTTTAFRQQVIPTTVFQTRLQTRLQILTRVVTQTSNDIRDQVVTRTVQRPGGEQTRFVTTTRVVQQVSTITSTQFQTQGVPVVITTTQFQTINRPFTNFFTQTRFDTRVVTVPGRDVVRTRVQTMVFTSIVRDTQPGNTQFVTTTLVQPQLTTVVVPGQNVISTRVVQRQTVVPFTSFNTRFESAFATSEVVVTSTSVETETQFQSQVVAQTVTQTKVIPTTSFAIIFSTRYHPFTQIQPVIQTRLVTLGPVFQTLQELITSIIQVPGPDLIITQPVFRTQHRQQVIYQTVSQDKPVVVTRTVTGSCVDAADYDYDYQLAGGSPYDRLYK